MTTDPNSAAVIAAWTHMRGNMQLDSLSFARHAFDAILDGNPTTIAAAANALSISIEEAKEHVAKFQAFGLMNLDGETIVGALGLTTQPTQYDVQINGRFLHVWCALDAVGIPAALQASAKVKVDGLAEVKIENGSLVNAAPDTLRISLADPYIGDDMRREICPNISFHEQAGKQHEKMAWLTVPEAMELGKMIWARPDANNTREENND